VEPVEIAGVRKNEWFSNRAIEEDEFNEDVRMQEKLVGEMAIVEKMQRAISVASSDSYKYMERVGFEVDREGRSYRKLGRKKYDYYYYNNNIPSEYYTVGREYWMPSKLYLEDAITDADKIEREIIIYEFFRFVVLRYEWPIEVIMVSALNGFDFGTFMMLIC
jgi:hypothetical protein